MGFVQVTLADTQSQNPSSASGHFPSRWLQFPKEGLCVLLYLPCSPFSMGLSVSRSIPLHGILQRLPVVFSLKSKFGTAYKAPFDLIFLQFSVSILMSSFSQIYLFQFPEEAIPIPLLCLYITHLSKRLTSLGLLPEHGTLEWSSCVWSVTYRTEIICPFVYLPLDWGLCQYWASFLPVLPQLGTLFFLQSSV